LLVLDANILICAGLGKRVHSLLRKYGKQVDEAREALPEILERHGVPAPPALLMLVQLGALVRIIEAEAYQGFEYAARQRIAHRDEDDWPILATALALDCAIWT
jgi:predicted nucleic acid-binding protein